MYFLQILKLFFQTQKSQGQRELLGYTLSILQQAIKFTWTKQLC